MNCISFDHTAWPTNRYSHRHYFEEIFSMTGSGGC